MQCLAVVSILNPPGEEMGLNHRARATSKVVVMVIFYLMQTYIMTKFVNDQNSKILIVYVNLLTMWFMLILQLFEDGAIASRKDITTLGMCVVSTILSSTLFSFVIKNMEI